MLGARTLAPKWALLMLGALAAVNGVLAAGLVASQAPTVPAASRPLLAGFDALTDQRGIYLARDKVEADLIERELGIKTENLRYFLTLPDDLRGRFVERFAAWVRELTAHGEPLYLHAEVLEKATTMPRLAKALDTILAGHKLVPIEAPGFVGVRVE